MVATTDLPRTWEFRRIVGASSLRPSGFTANTYRNGREATKWGNAAPGRRIIIS